MGVIEAASGRPEITRLLGARHGMDGILAEDFVDLCSLPAARLERVARTPGAALGSTRGKPTATLCARMFEVMRRRNVRFFFYIGGNDTAEAADIVSRAAQAAGYELRCVHLPKTIDNDLLVTDHCPGYGSAAKFVAVAFLGDDLDNRALPGIKLNVVMGRHAGWLTAASALARRHAEDGPHLIYVPERPVAQDRLCQEIAAVYARLGRCVVAVSEGIVDAADPDGRTFSEIIQERARQRAVERNEWDAVQLSGSGALGDWLAEAVRQVLPDARVRADTLGYAQRSFPGIVSRVDAAEARECGRRGVAFACEGNADGSIVIRRISQPRGYAVDYGHVPLRQVAAGTKVLPDEFIADSCGDVTAAFVGYAVPLVGEFPIAECL